MSGPESKVWQGHAGIHAQPTGAALPHPANFPPEYEAQVTENMRNFDKLEGQHNINSYHQTPRQDRVIVLNLRNKIIIGLLVLLLVGSLIFGIAEAVAHNKPAVCPKRSITEVSANPPATTTPGSVATRSFTQTTMITIAASQISAMMTAPATTSSSVNAAALSASLQSVASLKSFDSAYLSSLNAATASFVTRSTTIVPSTTTSTRTVSPTPPTSAPTEAASAAGRSNFCGVPGMFCLGG